MQLRRDLYPFLLLAFSKRGSHKINVYHSSNADFHVFGNLHDIDFALSYGRPSNKRSNLN